MTYRFRTEKIAEQQCTSCNGNSRVFVFGCRLHGACTEAKALWPEVNGRYRVCATCPDRDACVGTPSKAEWLLSNMRALRDGQPVERLERIGHDEFFRRYWSTATPVVFRVDVPAWTFAGLAERFGNRQVEVQAGRDADPLYEQRSHLHKVRMGFANFLNRVATETTNDIYMTANNTGANREALKELFAEVRPLPGIIDDPKQGFLWIGPTGAVTPSHFDLTCNILWQVLGKKRVLLVAPEWQPMMDNDFHVYSRVDLSKPNSGKPVPAEVIMEKGDVLFIPVGWFHWVQTLEPCIMLSHTNFSGHKNDFYKTFPHLK